MKANTYGMPSANTRQAQAQAEEACCSVIEPRRYAMKPGRRDDLIALFEEHFIEGQEQYGMWIIGQFRNRNNPDQFVWMRGFGDMEARRQALAGFYGGPIWQAHRTAASDTMIDSDNVMLLKPLAPHRASDWTRRAALQWMRQRRRGASLSRHCIISTRQLT